MASYASAVSVRGSKLVSCLRPLQRVTKRRGYSDWRDFNEYIAKVQLVDAPLAGKSDYSSPPPGNRTVFRYEGPKNP